LADVAESGNDDVRRNETVIANLRMMSDVIAAPEHDVIADGHKRLKHVVLEDETMLADLRVPPDKRVRADVRSRPIAHRLRRAIEPRPQTIEMRVNESGVERVILRRIQ